MVEAVGEDEVVLAGQPRELVLRDVLVVQREPWRRPARRAAAAGRMPPALWKAATDTSLSGCSTNSSTVCRARASALSTSAAAPASACPAAVSTTAVRRVR